MATFTVPLTDEQVIELATRLPPEAKRELLRVLISEMDRLDALVDYGEEQAREVAAARAVDWEGLTPSQREELVDQILHEP